MHVECQDDGQVAWSEERKLLEYHRGRGVFYPLIQVQKPAPSSMFQSLNPAAGEGSIEHESPSSPFAAVVAVTGGLLLIFYELSINDSGNPLLRAVLSCIILALAVLSADHVRLYRKDPQSARSLEQRFASLLGLLTTSPGKRTNNKGQASQAVKAITWHPYLNIFAVALSGESSEHLAFYDMDAEQWRPTVVKHQFQRAITCLQFQPNSGIQYVHYHKLFIRI